MVNVLELMYNASLVAHVEVEMAFSYGCLGYGAASQVRYSTPLLTSNFSNGKLVYGQQFVFHDLTVAS